MATQKTTAPEPVKNPTPKQRFMQDSALMSAHRVMVDNTTFQASLDYAMLEYQQMLSRQTSTANDAAMTGMKLQGAIEFMSILKNLSETLPPAPRWVDKDNLQH